MRRLTRRPPPLPGDPARVIKLDGGDGAASSRRRHRRAPSHPRLRCRRLRRRCLAGTAAVLAAGGNIRGGRTTSDGSGVGGCHCARALTPVVEATLLGPVYSAVVSAGGNAEAASLPLTGVVLPALVCDGS